MSELENTLYYGDNLNILREYIPSESVDLIYLDPPFNSNRSYNVLFKDESGQQSEAQITAFDDTWHWNEAAAATFEHIIMDIGGSVADMVDSLIRFMGRNQMTAYLVMMAARLVELHRVLKPTGSLYLHCDPTASHYLKVVLDAVFGPENFSNHVTWQRADTHNDAKWQFAAISDHILMYRKSSRQVFNPQYVPHAERTLRDWYQYLELPDGTVRRMTKDEKQSQKIPPGARRFNADNMTSPNPRPNLMYSYKGYPYPPNGWRYSLETMQKLDQQGKLLFPANPTGRIMLKRYLDEQKGSILGDVWTDISQLRAAYAEALGYPTQKPLALLERIIQASSNEGDVVLDPFCGCGTAIIAAEGLKRRWIGIDITHLAIALNKYRLEATYPGVKFRVVGEPEDLAGARQLAQDDRYQFQFWALSLIRARPYGAEPGSRQGKKGADRGVDGTINFMEAGGKVQRVLVQVKSGHVDSGQVTALAGAVEREKAAMGIFITLEPPSAPMRREAASAGIYTSLLWNEKYPKIQIVTVEELLSGGRVNMPPTHGTFKQARRAKPQEGGAQLAFPDEGDADE